MAFELAAANNAATGAPTISGAARVGETLTAATTGIMDTDGLSGVSYTYQWIREDSNGMNPVDIGTDSSTYALVTADLGKKIKVKVNFQDNGGNDEELTSAAYPSGMETVGEACDVLWCATLTVGTFTNSANETTYGYNAIEAYGSLSPRTFTRGTATVGVVFLAYDDPANGRLDFQIRRNAGTTPPDGLLGSAGLVLTLGSETFAFTPSSALQYEFDPTGLSWNEGDTVEVSLALAPATAPEPPTALEAAPYGDDAVLLSWTAPASGTTPTGYKVEVSDDGTTDWTDAEDDTESTDTSWIHEGLMASATRHYRVSSVASGTASTPSATDSATTCAAGVPWCPTLTAETATGFIGTAFSGFNAALTLPFGSLSPADFRHGGSTYTSDLLYHADVGGGNTRLSVSFESALPSALEGFALRSGAQELSLASAVEYSETAFTYVWDHPPFGPWTAGAEVAFELAAANTNTAPAITTTSPQSVAENTTAVTTLTATDADTGDTLTWSKNGGADEDKFTLTDAGVLSFTVAPDFEAPTDTGGDNGYVIIVRVSDATATADLTLTVNVTDEDEQPAKPDAPGVTATPGTTDSLTVSWTAPDRNGGPAIAGYDLQYRPGDSGDFMDGPQGVTGTTTDITGLTEATGYQVRVRALNGETPSEWSEPGTGDTGSPENDAPVFAESTLTREVAENTAADVNVGAAVTATDADADTLAYTLEGADADAFTIDGTSGQVKTKAGVSYDHETKASHEIAVRADDGNGGTATVAVTVNVTDVDEQPETPAAPSVGATPGSTTSLEVTWTKPGLNGGPDITGYAVQYRAGTDGSWLDHGHGGTGTSTTIGTLTARTQYQARVRALNGETPSEWSEPGSGATATAAGVTLSTASLAVGEGTEATYTVVLKAPPTGPVTVTPRVVDNAEVRVSGCADLHGHELGPAAGRDGVGGP